MLHMFCVFPLEDWIVLSAGSRAMQLQPRIKQGTNLEPALTAIKIKRKMRENGLKYLQKGRNFNFTTTPEVEEEGRSAYI